MPPIRFHGAALGCRDQGLPERMRQNARRKGRGKPLLEARSAPSGSSRLAKSTSRSSHLRVHAIGAIAAMPAKGNWAREALRPASYLGAAMGEFPDRRSIHCWTPKKCVRCFPIPLGFFPLAPQSKREHTAAH